MSSMSSVSCGWMGSRPNQSLVATLTVRASWALPNRRAPVASIDRCWASNCSTLTCASAHARSCWNSAMIDRLTASSTVIHGSPAVSTRTSRPLNDTYSSPAAAWSRANVPGDCYYLATMSASGIPSPRALLLLSTLLYEPLLLPRGRNSAYSTLFRIMWGGFFLVSLAIAAGERRQRECVKQFKLDGIGLRIFGTVVLIEEYLIYYSPLASIQYPITLAFFAGFILIVLALPAFSSKLDFISLFLTIGLSICLI